MTLLRRNPEMTWDDAGDRVVVLDAAGSTLITLNPVGSVLWEQLDRPRGADRLAEVLAERFPDEDPATLREDVDAFVTELVDAGLLLTGPDPG